MTRMTAGTNPWVRRFWQDLQPTPGRLAGTLHMVLATTIALILILVWRVPFGWIGLYFGFMVGRESPSASFRSGLFAILSVCASLATSLAVVILTDNDPVARLLSVVVVSFLAALFSVATTLPGLATIWGFIYCTMIAFWETHASANSIVEESLWLVAASTLPIVSVIAVEYVFGSRSPISQLKTEFSSRYDALATMFSLYAEDADATELADARLRVIRLAAAGQSGMQRLYNTIVDRNLDPQGLPVGARVRLVMLAQLMDIAAAFGSDAKFVREPDTHRRCTAITAVCRRLSTDSVDGSSAWQKPNLRMEGSVPLLDQIEGMLDNILSMPAEIHPQQDRNLIALASNKVPLFIPGAINNKDNISFALKICLCATLCYILYFAVDWPGIATSVVTVFITGLGTTGAFKQKSLFRFLGSAVGGLIFGIGSAAFLFPYMDSVTSLTILVGSITFISAWIGGGRVFNYVGLQIAFSFYLVAMEGYRSPTELAPARDRLVGILLALAVMWFVFDQLWPVRTVTVMRRALASIFRDEAKLFRMRHDVGTHDERLRLVDSFRDQIGKTMASLRTMNDQIEYEFGVDRHAHSLSGEAIINSAFSAVTLFWNELAILHADYVERHATMPAIEEMRHEIADSMDAMADAVLQMTPYRKIDTSSFVSRASSELPENTQYVHHALQHFEEVQLGVLELEHRV